MKFDTLAQRVGWLAKVCPCPCASCPKACCKHVSCDVDSLWCTLHSCLSYCGIASGLVLALEAVEAKPCMTQQQRGLVYFNFGHYLAEQPLE